MKKLSIIFFLGIFAFISCKDATTKPDPKTNTWENLKEISGKVLNPNKNFIPEDAKAVLLWHVYKASPSYAWVSHEGTFNKSDMTFHIDLSELPSDTCINAYNSGKLGVAYIMLVKESYPLGKYDSWNDIYGAKIGTVTDNALIFIEGEKGIISMSMPWVDRFSAGFSLGSADYTTNAQTGLEGWSISSSESDIVIDLGKLWDENEKRYPDWKPKN